MSKFAVGNIFLVASMFCTTASHVLIKSLVDQSQGKAPFEMLVGLLAADKIVRSLTAGGLLIAGFTFWIVCLSRLSLSYAYPLASTSVLLVAGFSIAVLGETITPKMWAGTALIVIGVILLSPSS